MLLLLGCLTCLPAVFSFRTAGVVLLLWLCLWLVWLLSSIARCMCWRCALVRYLLPDWACDFATGWCCYGRYLGLCCCLWLLVAMQLRFLCFRCVWGDCGLLGCWN